MLLCSSIEAYMLDVQISSEPNPDKCVSVQPDANVKIHRPVTHPKISNLVRWQRKVCKRFTTHRTRKPYVSQ